MKFYALPKVDGGVAIMQCVGDPAVELSKWHPDRRAIVTGEIHEIDPNELPKDRAHRDAWAMNGKKVEVDSVKKAALQVRPSIEDRLSALEAKDKGRA